MGGSSSSECGMNMYPGLDPKGKPTCMNAGWMRQNSPDIHTLSPNIRHAYTKVNNILTHSGRCSNKMRVWWLLSWIHLGADNSDKQDIITRRQFITKMLESEKGFNPFLTEDKAWNLARVHENKWFVFLSDSVPGTVHFLMIKNQQPFTAELTVSNVTYTKQTLSNIIRSLFSNIQSVRYYKREKDQCEKSGRRTRTRHENAAGSVTTSSFFDSRR